MTVVRMRSPPSRHDASRHQPCHSLLQVVLRSQCSSSHVVGHDIVSLDPHKEDRFSETIDEDVQQHYLLLQPLLQVQPVGVVHRDTSFFCEEHCVHTSEHGRNGETVGSCKAACRRTAARSSVCWTSCGGE